MNLSVLALLLLLSNGGVSACSCYPQDDLPTSIQKNEAAVRVKVYRQKRQSGAGSFSDRYFEARVWDVYKGCKVSEDDVILIKTSSNSCGFNFVENLTYLLVGRVIKEDSYSGSIFAVGSCSFTRKWQDVRKEDKCLLAGSYDEPVCEPIACTADAKVCPDGTTVGRDADKKCQFKPCPKLTCDLCPGGFDDGCNVCSCDGKYGVPICTLRACGPGDVLGEGSCKKVRDRIECTGGPKLCSDGSRVSQDPNNGCAYPSCPTPKTSGLDCRACPRGFFDGCNRCRCRENGLASCTRRFCLAVNKKEPHCFCSARRRLCWDGTRVKQNPKNDCRYDPCPKRDF